MRFAPVLLLGVSAAWAFQLAAQIQTPPSAIQAPPPAIPQQFRDALLPPETATPARAGQGTTLYSIGEPTDDEQHYLELINRTRISPVSESVWLANVTDPDVVAAYNQYEVNLAVFIADTSAFPPVAPLAFEPRLIQAARGHSQWMLDAGIQSHDQINPDNGQVLNTAGQRITAAGYPWSTFGESIYAYAKSPLQGHAGFEVDWGFGPNGMQDPPGHRINNHSAAYREIGVGVINGTGANGTGPQSVSIEFASRAGLAPFVTGVAYYDLNGNQNYDAGEGLGGVTVNVSGSGHHAVTSASGGYAVPSGNGARTVTFTTTALSPQTQNVTIAGGQNVKADLRLTYTPPAISGPATPGVGFANAYALTPVPGATKYVVRSGPLTAWTGVEGAENGTANVTAQTTAGYTVVNAGYKRTGTAGFHLAHPQPPPSPGDQWLTLNQRFLVQAGGRLVFWTRLGFATPDQTAVAQISTDDGVAWTTVWSQPGNGANTTGGIENAFSQRTVMLTDYVNRQVRVRFGFRFAGGSFFPLAAGPNYNNTGFFLDDIAFENVGVLGAFTEQEVAGGTGFGFTPAAAIQYLLSARPVAGTRELPPGPSLLVTASTQVQPVALAIAGLTSGPNGRLRLDFMVTSGNPAEFILERKPSLTAAGWTTVADATLSNEAPGSYSFRFFPQGEVEFLRVRTP